MYVNVRFTSISWTSLVPCTVPRRCQHMLVLPFRGPRLSPALCRAGVSICWYCHFVDLACPLHCAVPVSAYAGTAISWTSLVPCTVPRRCQHMLVLPFRGPRLSPALCRAGVSICWYCHFVDLACPLHCAAPVSAYAGTAISWTSLVPCTVPRRCQHMLVLGGARGKKVCPAGRGALCGAKNFFMKILIQQKKKLKITISFQN